MRFRPAFLLLAAIVAARPEAAAQQLRLGEALDRADRQAFVNRVQRAMASAEDATARLALRGMLPALRVDAGFVHTTDPIGTFGTTMRQRAITEQDFDAARLNHPATARNVVGAIVLEQPIFNGDAWAGRRAAMRAADAADATAHWTRLATRTGVVRAYLGAMLAAEQVATLETAARASAAHVRQAESMAANGIVTSSDALLASVKAGDVETQVLKARGDAVNARRSLLTILGDTAGIDMDAELPDALPDAATVRRIAAELTAGPPAAERADITAVRQGREAAEAGLLRARSTLVPRVNSFARYDWNDPRRAFGGESNWTIGVMASWSIFTGAAELSDVQAAAHRRHAAEAMHDGVAAQARLEVARTATAHETALARLEIAERSVLHATDAHRIVGRRYAGGLATIVELLDAAAMETQARLAASAARHDVLVATAEHLQATGRDPGTLRLLDHSQ